MYDISNVHTLVYHFASVPQDPCNRTACPSFKQPSTQQTHFHSDMTAQDTENMASVSIN